MVCQMLDNRGKTSFGMGTVRTAAFVFGGPKTVLPSVSSSACSRHPGGSVQGVDVPPPEADGFAEAHAGERAKEHEGPVFGFDGVSDGVDLCDGRRGALGTVLCRGALDDARVNDNSAGRPPLS